MMFRDDYKNEMDNIKPDGYVKYRIKERLLKTEQRREDTPKGVYFTKTMAAVLALAIALSAGILIGRFSSPNIKTAQNPSLLNAVGSYGEIYKSLEEFKPSFWDSFTYNYYTDDAEEVIPETEAATGTAVDDGGADFGSAANKNHSETTAQVEGVGEADVVKTDGEYIYILSLRTKYGCIKIVKVGEELTQLADIKTPDGINPRDMYLKGDRLVVLCSIFTDIKNETVSLVYDVSSPESPVLIEECRQSGELHTSRLIGNKLYVLTNFCVNVNDMVKSNTESYVPQIFCANSDGSVAADTVHIYNNCSSPEYTVLSAFDISDGRLVSTSSVLGGTRTLYASTDNIIIAGMTNENKTEIARFEIIDGKITLMAAGELSGSLLNQFSIDEYKGSFRFVLTEAVSEKAEDGNKSLAVSSTVNSLVVMDGNLKQIGKISDLAPGERVYSVRFMGDTAYFVTFRQVDPLFSADLSDPANPKIIGALKIPGFSNYLFPYGEGKLLGIGQNADENTGRTEGMKLSMFDISDPSNVTEQDKTDIPSLYAECLNNHKAALVDKDRNLIAFAANGTFKSNAFFVYSYENGEFVKRLEAELDTYTDNCRGLYIGDTFYIVTEYKIECYSIEDFEKTLSLTLKQSI